MKNLSLVLLVCMVAMFTSQVVAFADLANGASHPPPDGVTLSPSTYNFGTVAQEFSYYGTFTLTNGGSSSISISSIVAFPSPPFWVSPTGTTCGSALSVGQQCNISVLLVTQTTENLPATLTVTTSAGILQSSLYYNPEPDVLLTPQIVQYNNLPCNQEVYFSPPCYVTVTNYQPIPVTISSIAMTYPFVITTSDCPTTLAAYGGQCVVGIEVAPSFVGNYASGTLTLTTTSRDGTPPPLQVIYCGRRYCG